MYQKIGGFRERQILGIIQYGPVPLGRIREQTRMHNTVLWHALDRMMAKKLLTFDKGIVTPMMQTGSRWHRWDMTRPITKAI